MNDYDKAFMVVRDRFFGKSSATFKTINSFVIRHDRRLAAIFDDGYLYVCNEKYNIISIEDDYYEQTMSTVSAIKHLVQFAKDHDIYVGIYHHVKILSKGDTLESLAIEHDLSLRNLDF